MTVPVPQIPGHPQASVAGGLTGVGALVVAVAGWMGASLTATQAVAISGAITTVGLLIGRKGLRGIARMIWKGNQP